VAKSKPQQKIRETDDICQPIEPVTPEALNDPTTLPISMDAKAAVKIGPFSRGGQNRVPTTAGDHDFMAQTRVTPYGIFLPESDELFWYLISSQVTSDGMVDILEPWWPEFRERFHDLTTLVLKPDNGPENHSRRTQLMKRLVELVHQDQINVRWAYYPPYHSKYNPIERTWATLEHHWNGAILDEVQTAQKFAQTMTWKGKNPVVKLINRTDKTGIKLTQKAMAQIETQIKRLSPRESKRQPNLGKWFVDICYSQTQ
jgi:transposase